VTLVRLGTLEAPSHPLGAGGGPHPGEHQPAPVVLIGHTQYVSRVHANTEDVIEALRSLGSAERAEQEKRYLKSDLDFLGVRLPDIRSVVKRQPNTDELVNALWRLPLWEARMAAVELLKLRIKNLTTQDLPRIETMIREGAGWALVDPLAGDIAGRVALRHPDAWPVIDGWSADQDFWVRRSALLCLLPGIRAGQPDLVRLDRYAEAMLGEKEFFIRKAIGWVLRELSKKDPGYVSAWTERHLAELSGVTFREAVRRLPAADAARLTAARRKT
jgi:3-methyladenine DNA glycosylase AlkD